MTTCKFYFRIQMYLSNPFLPLATVIFLLGGTESFLLSGTESLLNCLEREPLFFSATESFLIVVEQIIFGCCGTESFFETEPFSGTESFLIVVEQSSKQNLLVFTINPCLLHSSVNSSWIKAIWTENRDFHWLLEPNLPFYDYCYKESFFLILQWRDLL